ncbi:MAG TPA: VWA domain-containing protein [Bacteroidetes bacterium]|nr:VWA domain-containing protein [Bacteroidota bacterium]
MRFADFQMIHLIWIVGLIIAFLIWRKSKKDQLREKFADKKLFDEISDNLFKQNEWLKIFLVALICIFSVIALMRPQWGFQWQEVKREGLNIIVAIDTSKSMLTDDVKPNRLARSKLAVRDLVKKLEGDRIGLIAFSGTGFLVCPLTIDYQGFLLTLDNINTNTIPQGGTSISTAIKEAMRSYKKTKGKYKSMIIITDGEDLEGDVLELAKEASKEGIKIFTIGIGTKEGELIRVPNKQGGFEFVKDKDGNFVKSRLNERLLQELALVTDGVYVQATGAQFGLEYIYNNYLSKMEKQEIKTTMEKRYYDRFQIPLAIAFILLCGFSIISTRKDK